MSRNPTIAVAQMGPVQLTAATETETDEMIVVEIDLDSTKRYRETLSDFDLYRVPEAYARITSQRGVITPPEETR
jgi:hypothetical protein